MKEWFPAADIAGLPGLPGTVQNVNVLAKRQQWARQPRKGRGGGYEYHISSLPPAARAELGVRVINEQRQGCDHAQAGAAAGRRLAIANTMKQRGRTVAREQGLNGYVALSERGRTRADARAAILAELKAFGQSAALTGRRAVDAFAAKYNLGEIQVEDWVREQVETVAAATLYRWQKRYNDEGVAALAGAYKGQAGRSLIDRQPELKTFVTSMLNEFPHITCVQVMKAARARFSDTGVELPSKRRLEVWIANWKRDNASLHTAATNPDAWKNKYMAAFGSYSEDVTRLNQRWELDSTPADVMLLDGRYSVVGAIDVYSRRPKLLISRTSKASSVGQLLRRCFIDWGIPEEIKTDNGSDYTSRYIKNVIQSLDIEQRLCIPFSGWEKPHIERFFETFSHDLVELLPGYIGHNVSERSAIEARKSFAERLYKKDQAVELRMTAQEFQAFADEWVENIYMQQQHGSLRDTPFNRVARWDQPVRKISDERALDVLLAGAPDTTTRTVTKKGLRIDGINYIAPELGTVIGDTVRVAYTESVGAVYVFTDDGFLCVAEAPEYTGIDRKEVAAHAKIAQRESVQAARRQLRAAARKAGVKTAADEILAHARQQRNVTALPARSDSYTTEALEQAALAAEATTVKPVAPRNDETRQAVADLRANLAAPRTAAVVPMGTNPKADYRRWKALDAKVRAGDLLSQQEKAFYEGYPKTTDFTAMQEFFQRFGLEAEG